MHHSDYGVDDWFSLNRPHMCLSPVLCQKINPLLFLKHHGLTIEVFFFLLS